jgi:hypothetical protein
MMRKQLPTCFLLMFIFYFDNPFAPLNWKHSKGLKTTEEALILHGDCKWEVQRKSLYYSLVTLKRNLRNSYSSFAATFELLPKDTTLFFFEVANEAVLMGSDCVTFMSFHAPVIM